MWRCHQAGSILYLVQVKVRAFVKSPMWSQQVVHHLSIAPCLSRMTPHGKCMFTVIPFHQIIPLLQMFLLTWTVSQLPHCFPGCQPFMYVLVTQNPSSSLSPVWRKVVNFCPVKMKWWHILIEMGRLWWMMSVTLVLSALPSVSFWLENWDVKCAKSTERTFLLNIHVLCMHQLNKQARK